MSSINDDAGTGSGSLESYSYLGLDTIVQRTRPNNTDLTYIGSTNGPAGDKYVGLDEFGRVVDQNWQTTSTGVSIDRFQYGYDANGNVLYKNNLMSSSNSELYHANGSGNGYDALNRLVAFSRGTLNGTNDSITTSTHTTTWTLDVLGNRTGLSDTTTGTTTEGFNARNEVSTISGKTYLTGSNSALTPTFDNNGNMTKDEIGNQYIYDAWNRLKQIKNSSGTVLETFTYDALGRRITQTVGSTTTDLYYDTGGRVLEERQGSTTTAQYVWGLGYTDALIERDAGGVRMYAQQDANWNVTSLTDSSGAVQERYQYDPYGTVTVLSPNFTVKGTGQVTASSYNWLYLFQDGRIDTTTMLYHFRARDYSPSLGRWTEPDPIGYGDGPNVYQVDSSNPASESDPTGLWGEDGHFWTTFLMARAANIPPDLALQLAYYAQLPDQVPLYDAAEAGKRLLVWGTDDEAFDSDVQNWLHSLMGGTRDDLLKRRKCLEKMLKDPTLLPWQRGFIMHAWEDTYAHQHRDGTPYSGPFGHADWPWNDWGHPTDWIGEKPGAWSLYAYDLFTLVGGDINNLMQSDNLIWIRGGVLKNLTTPSMSSYMEGFAKLFGYSWGWTPGDHNNWEDKFYTPNKQEVKDLIKRMKSECNCFKSAAGK